ncbi:MAG: O-antigen ligase family protein [Gammaproteobacteria bacterium]|nr:O-antigen ligase family protein [Gammaproteobacteria bacterium]
MITSNSLLDKTYQYLFIAFGFCLPLTLSGSNLLAYSIVILWLLSGNYYNKFKQIVSNKVSIAAILYFFTFVIGLLWSDNVETGLNIIKRTLPFLLLIPIFLTITKKAYIKYYLGAFLLAMSIAEISSYLVFFEIVPPFRKATLADPSVFMDHISYNPFLAIAIYIILNKLLFERSLTGLTKYLYIIFALTASINMFITGGRAGQIMYFSMLVILIFQYFHKQILKAIIFSVLVIPTIFITAYSTSDIFHNRANKAITTFTNFEDNQTTSTGQRITFVINSLRIIKQNPVFGVGTGDFTSEYRKINQQHTPALVNTSNPHNMYVFIGVQLGIVGIVIMLWFFYSQLKFAVNINENKQKNFAIALPLLYLLICLSGLFILGNNSTALLFVFLSGFLYKNFEQ